MSQVPENVRAVLAELRRRVDGRFGGRLRRVTLFGSYARGEAGPDSDVDVLVVIDDLTHAERTLIHETAADLWMDSGVRLAPLAIATSDLEELEHRELLITQDIAREGIPV